MKLNKNLLLIKNMEIGDIFSFNKDITAYTQRDSGSLNNDARIILKNNVLVFLKEDLNYLNNQLNYRSFLYSLEFLYNNEILIKKFVSYDIKTLENELKSTINNITR